jgi:hypothetical protein
MSQFFVISITDTDSVESRHTVLYVRFKAGFGVDTPRNYPDYRSLTFDVIEVI